MTRRSVLGSVLQGTAALCGVGFAWGQDQPTFSTELKVVNVLATVRNKTGAVVGGLGKDDFRLSLARNLELVLKLFVLSKQFFKR